MTTTPSKPSSDNSTPHPTQTSAEDTFPQYDTILVRCDGSYKRHKDLASIGYVLKQRDDTIVEKHHSEAKPATTNIETEAHALLESLRAAKKYNPTFIMLYSDCKPVIDKVTTGGASAKKDIYLKIKDELRGIKIVKIKHTPRENNKEAHDLAGDQMKKLEDKY